MNNITITGRFTRDAETAYTPSGVQLTKFSVAVDRTYKEKDKEKEADFFNCVAWRHQAKFIADYIKKGRLVAVTGEMQSRHYVAQDTGKKVTVWELVASRVEPLGPRPDGAGEPEHTEHTEAPTPEQAHAEAVHDEFSGEDEGDPFASE